MLKLNKYDPKSGPLQIVHDFKFTALNVKDDYSILDGIDRDAKLDYIKARLDRLHMLGYGGVVMNVDYHNYLNDDSAFALFTSAAEYAKSIGMRVWIYDEQYYPSGSAGGLTLKGHPEFEAIALACVTKDVDVDPTVGPIRIPSPYGYSELKYAIIAPIKEGRIVHDERLDISLYKDLAGGLCFDAPIGKWRVYCFFLRPLYEQTKFCQGTRASRRYISVFNKKAVERFYDVTFENGYKAHMSKPLSSIVEAVFTDEPYSPFYRKTNIIPTRTAFPSESVYDEPLAEVNIYPYVPWEITVPERFEAKYGRSILTVLPDIFYETSETRRARIDFYSLLSEMSREALPVQLQDKLSREGIALSGHYYGEEGFDFQPAFYGDILEHLAVMEIPGCDCLWSDIEVLRYSTACKLASSAAHLADKDGVMIEASNMIDKDQNITLKRAKAAISTMFVHGVNLVTSYYGENMLPDSEMHEFTQYIASLASMFKGGKYKINTLLYYPFENLCADCGPQGIVEGNDNGEDHLGISATSAKLMNHQVAFDLINKAKLLSCEVLGGYVLTPNGERVESLVFPNIQWLDEDVARFAIKARNNGIKIIFDGEAREIENLGCIPDYLTNGVYPKSIVSLKTENPYILSMCRDFGEYSLIMLMNTDTNDASIKVTIDMSDEASISLIDPTSDVVAPINPVMTEEKRWISLDVPALEAIVIAVY